MNSDRDEIFFMVICIVPLCGLDGDDEPPQLADGCLVTIGNSWVRQATAQKRDDALLCHEVSFSHGYFALTVVAAPDT
jgi:hypothetical protein